MFRAGYHLFQTNFLSKTSMVDLVECVTSLLFFDIPLLCYYINLRSSIMFLYYPEDIFLSPSIFVSLLTVSDIFCGELHLIYVILSRILLPIKSPAVSAALELLLLKQL